MSVAVSGADAVTKMATTRAFLCLLAACSRSCEGASKPNILMAVFDDLRPALEPYESYSHTAVTPNIQKLAAAPGTVVFDHAYVQQAVCGPRYRSLCAGTRAGFRSWSWSKFWC